MQSTCRYALGLLLTTAILVPTLGASSSYAQSNACVQLERQLASISTGNNTRPSRKFRQYDRAVKEQRRQMQKTRRIAERSGCNPDSRLGIGRCGRYISSLKKMQANLSQLSRTRDSLSTGGARNTTSQRKQVLRKMRRLGCGSGNIRSARVETTAKKRRSLVEQIFGVRTYGEDGSRNGADGASSARRGGTYRTMCVRTCDGYYFPVSFSTVPQRFEFDEHACQSMCPGTETALYFHAMPSQDAEQMISYRTDQPYSTETFAFNYRKSLNKECSCKFSQAGLQEFAGGANETKKQAVSEGRSSHNTIGTPVFRPDRNEDLESRRNLAGALTLEALASLGEKPQSRDDRIASLADKIESEQIRIVGPAFFPVQ